MMEFEAGDRVKVIGQDIVGTVLRVHYDTNEVVIQDDYSEYEACLLYTSDAADDP